MKFGKKLAAEAARRTDRTEHYLDYKLVKRALKDDLRLQDSTGELFRQVLLQELHKVSSFYVDRAGALEAILEQHLQKSASASGLQLPDVLSATHELIRFVALNHLAVVKAIKKRNRRLKEAFGEGRTHMMHPLDVLSREVFFTSPRLAALATQAEVLSTQPAAATAKAAETVREEYECTICMELLCNPVVLTCAHRFCWGCLVAHYAAIRSVHAPHSSEQEHKDAHGEGDTDTPPVVPASVPRPPSLVILEKLVANYDSEEHDHATHNYYTCPLCRKPQVFSIESMQVDPHLSTFVDGLRTLQLTQESAAAVPAAPGAAAAAPGPPTLLPPMAPRHAGRMTVLLDLDGTLVSSYTPRRAPRLPPSVVTHLVGQGSKLNPQGVFVVERPGLKAFLEQLAAFAEVVVFTAGLEDYARPIVDAIDPDNTLFAGRIYREGTVKTPYYQCVKDMQSLGRDLCRTVLVDDTPLAFLHQPHNGIPILGFRGDPDDRLLAEAVLPLLQSLASAPDVRVLLQHRFEMFTWFKRHNYPVDQWVSNTLPLPGDAAPVAEPAPAAPATSAAAPDCCEQEAAELAAPQQPEAQAKEKEKLRQGGLEAVTINLTASSAAAPPTCKDMLLLLDFDNTLVDFDSGERLVEALAPELLPQLRTLEQQHAADYIPLTNDILSEIQRRGVSSDRLLSELQLLGQEVPQAVSDMLQAAHQRSTHLDVKVLSDANSVFISHVLRGARLEKCVGEVITNSAEFQRVELLPATDGEGTEEEVELFLGAHGAGVAPAPPPSGRRLVVSPRQPSPHGCCRCPSNLCKGAEVRRLRASGAWRRVVYAGDGANDICAALALGPDDVLLARYGMALDQFVAAAAGQGQGGQGTCVQARVHQWRSFGELGELVQGLLPSA